MRVIKREKRGSHCEEEQGVATAPAPAQIVPKGKLSNEFIIEVLVRKYQLHLPVYRQCAALAEDFGIELSRKTLTDAILAAGSLLRRGGPGAAPGVAGRGIYSGRRNDDALPDRRKDRTQPPGVHVGVQPAREASWSLSFRWAAGGRVRGSSCKAFAANSKATAMASMTSWAKALSMSVAWRTRGGVLWTRPKLAPLDPVPPEILARFAELYAVEKEAREGALGPEARLALRQAKSVPVMAALENPTGGNPPANHRPAANWPRPATTPWDSGAGWKSICRTAGSKSTTTGAKAAMRPLALGRKNWLHVGSPEAGPKIAAIASIVETCRRLDINLRDYLRDVLPKLGDWPINRVGELTPTAWKATHTKKSNIPPILPASFPPPRRPCQLNVYPLVSLLYRLGHCPSQPRSRISGWDGWKVFWDVPWDGCRVERGSTG